MYLPHFVNVVFLDVHFTNRTSSLHTVQTSKTVCKLHVPFTNRISLHMVPNNIYMGPCLAPMALYGAFSVQVRETGDERAVARSRGERIFAASNFLVPLPQCPHSTPPVSALTRLTGPRQQGNIMQTIDALSALTTPFKGTHVSDGSS